MFELGSACLTESEAGCDDYGPDGWSTYEENGYTIQVNCSVYIAAKAVGAIVGIVVGILVCVCCVICCICYLCKKTADAAGNAAAAAN